MRVSRISRYKETTSTCSSRRAVFSALARMMQSFCIRSAKGLNKLMGRKRGTVFGDRYHSRSLGTPTETRATIVYVLQNARKHLTELGHALPRGWLDLEY